MKGIHPIGVVVRKTGLSSHVIRTWEKRYGAVSPERSEGNQRLYSDDDIDRLALLAGAVGAGESIGRIARLSDAQLRQVAGLSIAGLSTAGPTAAGETGRIIGEALNSIEASHHAGLRSTLTGWLYAHGVIAFTEQLLPRLLHRVGELWEDGKLQIYQEHSASETIRNFLGEVLENVNPGSGGTTVITAAPPGELHEMGALLCAIIAALEGFDVVHLGSNVPLPEISHLARTRRTAAVLLSFVCESRDDNLVRELHRLREAVDPQTHIIIGGRAAQWYGSHLSGTGVEYVALLSKLRVILTGATGEV
ncbi:MAG: MerR family transcriptional regulator [Spirochaetales bacterium]|nr:MerR family transcriptional regulator [Spirochaetales bacterium]